MKYRINYNHEEFGDIETDFEDVEAESAEEAIKLVKKYLNDCIIDNGYRTETTEDEIHVMHKGKTREIYSNFKAVKKRG